MSISSLRPDYLIQDTALLTPEALSEQGITTVVFDVDGTPTDYHDTIDEVHTAMMRRLGEAGLHLFIVSNAYGRRAQQLKRIFTDLAIPEQAVITPRTCLPAALSESPRKFRKPHPAMINLALAMAECRHDEFLMVGDQLYKDIKAANRAGVRSLLVPRLGDGDYPAVRYIQRPAEGIVRQLLALPRQTEDFPDQLTTVADYQARVVR